MKYYFLLIFSVFHAYALSFPVYDMSEELIKSSHIRSKYYLTSSFLDFGINYQEFIQKADKSKGLIVHSHGCSGVGQDESQLRIFYTKLGFYFVQLDFHKRSDARASCIVTNGILNYHDNIFTRIPPRVAELRNHVNRFRADGFEKIYISGHSEGGIVVQNFPDEVNGAIIHSVFCFPLIVHANNEKTQYLHLVSLNDPLLPQRGVPHTCHNRPNYTTVTSRVASHGPLADSAWSGKIKEFLGVNN